MPHEVQKSTLRACLSNHVTGRQTSATLNKALAAELLIGYIASHINSRECVYIMLGSSRAKRRGFRGQILVRSPGLSLDNLTSVTYKTEYLGTFRRCRCVFEACSSIYHQYQSKGCSSKGTLDLFVFSDFFVSKVCAHQSEMGGHQFWEQLYLFSRHRKIRPMVISHTSIHTTAVSLCTASLTKLTPYPMALDFIVLPLWPPRAIL